MFANDHSHWSQGSFGFPWVIRWRVEVAGSIRVREGTRRVRRVSLGLGWVQLGVAGFIRVLVGSLGRA